MRGFRSYTLDTESPDIKYNDFVDMRESYYNLILLYQVPYRRVTGSEKNFDYKRLLRLNSASSEPVWPILYIKENQKFASCRANSYLQ